MTLLIEHGFTVPRRDRARVVHQSWPSRVRGRREGRASTDTRGPRATKKHGEGTTGFSRITRPSLRDGFTPYTCSPQEPGFLAPVASRSFCSLDLSVGRPGPHDFGVRIGDVRPRD